MRKSKWTIMDLLGLWYMAGAMLLVIRGTTMLIGLYLGTVFCMGLYIVTENNKK